MMIMFAAICTLSFMALRPALQDNRGKGTSSNGKKVAFAPL